MMFNKYMVLTALLGTGLMATTVYAVDGETQNDRPAKLPARLPVVPDFNEDDRVPHWHFRDCFRDERSRQFWEGKAAKHPDQYRIVGITLEVYS